MSRPADLAAASASEQRASRRSAGSSPSQRATPAEAVWPALDHVDYVLIMSVNPGWGGQPFIPESPTKVSRLRELVGATVIEVDGGVDPSTAASVSEAGAGLFVAGSAIFKSDDPVEAYRKIAAAAGAE